MANNINQYTVPSDVERSRMLKIIHEHHKSLQTLLSKAESARKTLESSVETRALSDVEESHRDGAQQERQTTSSVDPKVKAAQRSLSKLEAKIEQLKGVLEFLGTPHPIRRCPKDILEYIFEFCQDQVPEGERLGVAIGLSYVCYRWRETAVGFSTLWSTLQVSLDDGAIDINRLWSEMSSRVKGIPVNITISDIYDEDILCTILDSLDFTVFQRINTLRLHIGQYIHTRNEMYRSVRSLIEDTTFRLPAGGLERLDIVPLYGYEKQDTDPSPLIRQLSTSGKLHTIKICEFDFENIFLDVTFEFIKCLYLDACCGLQPERLIHAFPNAQLVEISSSVFSRSRQGYDSRDFPWLYVETLVFERSWYRFSWDISALHCFTLPKVKRLRVDGNFDLRNFLDRHPCLRILDAPEMVYPFHGLESSPPRLTSLSLGVDCIFGRINWQDFPDLRTLTIYDDNEKKALSCILVDKIVSARFLPGCGGDEVAGQEWTTPVLVILVSESHKISNKGPRDWERSTWVASARRDEGIITRHNRKYYSFAFQWH